MCECWAVWVWLNHIGFHRQGAKNTFFFFFCLSASCVLFFFSTLLFSFTFLGYCCCWEVLSEVRVPSLVKLANALYFAKKRHTKTVFILSSYFFLLFSLWCICVLCVSFHSSSKIIQILVLHISFASYKKSRKFFKNVNESDKI